MRRDRRPGTLAFTVLGGLLVVLVIRNATGAGGWPAWTMWLYNAVEIGAVAVCGRRAATRRRERAAWTAMTAALACYAAGDLFWTIVYESAPAADVPYPSPADALYLAFFPLCYLAIALLVRARAGRLEPLQWLDGLIAALALASLGSAVLFERVVTDTGGAPLTVATNLAYPLGDLVLVAFVAGLVAVFGRAASRTWLMLGAALVVFAVFDTLYLDQTARETYVADGLLDIGWPLAFLLFAGAAWLSAERIDPARLRAGRSLAVPALAGVAILALQVFDHYDRVPLLSVWLAAAGAVCLIARFLVVFQANRRMLARSERDARTDALTGLANRRRLVEALEMLERERRPAVLALFDLDGFKAYNDRFGHPAGDVLLRRLAQRLAGAVPAPGSAFRIGGDEFCVLVEPAQAAATLIAAEAALSERGDGFVVTGSHGAVWLPDEAATASDALTLVDSRMYAAKRSGRSSAGAQTRDVLLRAVQERYPRLGAHVGDVAGLAVRVAAELALPADEIQRVRSAAQLHDVGKLAIPDAILDKPGPLDEAEWAFMHRHTIVGERILLAAPALAPVAPLVRASHERWDGGGYPDGVAGAQIPLGARIISVCDAWDAMVTDRPYRAAIGFDNALAEIERNAGTQFDPAVAAALRAVVARAESRAVAA